MGIVGKIRRFQKEYGTWNTLKKIYYRYVIKYHVGKKYGSFFLEEEEKKQQTSWLPEKKITISLVVPLYNTKPEFLREMIDSVVGQTYPCWELCLVDGSESHVDWIEEILKEYDKFQDRIRYKKLESNEGISENTNRGLEISTGEYIGLLDHDDLLHPSALYYVAHEIIDHEADFIYTDELSFTTKKERIQSIHLKPDFAPESFRCNNYICHFSVFSKALMDKAGMFRKEYDGSQDYDMILRLTDKASNIKHIDKILYFWRCHKESVASQAGAKPYTIVAGEKAVSQHLERKNIASQVESSSLYGPFYYVHYEVIKTRKVLVYTENNQVKDWVEKDLSELPYSFHVLSMEELDIESPLELEKLESFDYLFLVRDGYYPEKAGGAWMEELLQCLVPEENVVAGATAYTTKGKLHHGGYCYYNSWKEKIRPLYQGSTRKDPGYMNRLSFRQNISLLGGGVLGMRKKVYLDFVVKNQRTQRRSRDGWGLFSDMVWFSLCFTGKHQGGECIISPYAPFVTRDEIKEKEYTIEHSLHREEWKEFHLEWDRLCSKPDPYFNKGMAVFGKYYFLW